MRAVIKNGIGLKSMGATHSENTHALPKHYSVPTMTCVVTCTGLAVEDTKIQRIQSPPFRSSHQRFWAAELRRIIKH